MRKWCASRAGLLGILVALATALGFLGPLWWPLDLFSHFRFHYAIASFPLALLALLGQRRMAIPAVLAFFVNAISVAGLYSYPGHGNESRQLRVMHFNVGVANTRHAEVLNYLKQSDADLIFVLETNTDLSHALYTMGPPYYTLLALPASDSFGLHVLAHTRTSTRAARVINLSLVPSVEVTLQVEDREWVILGTHPTPPINTVLAEARDEQLERIAAWSKKEARPHVVAGDLNVTPFSLAFRALLKEGELVATTRGYTPTWPYGAPLVAMLRIPIDHLLHSKDLVAVASSVGPNLGSDHRPLVTDLALRR